MAGEDDSAPARDGRWWRAMLGVAIASVALQVCGVVRFATDPPTLVPVADSTDLTADSRAERTTREPSRVTPVAAPVADAPSAAVGDSPALPAAPPRATVDSPTGEPIVIGAGEQPPVRIADPEPVGERPESSLERIRELVALRTEQAREERERASAHERSEDAPAREEPAEATDELAAPTFELVEAGDYAFRRYAETALLAALALLLWIERRRAGGALLGFIGGLLLVLVGLELSAESPWVSYAAQALWLALPTGHLWVLPFALLALGAPRRRGALFALVVGAALAIGALDAMSAEPLAWRGWSVIAVGLAGVVPWSVAAAVSRQRAREASEPDAALGRGPYRDAAAPEREAPRGPSPHRAAVALYGWLGAQLAAPVLATLFSVHPASVDSALFAADVLTAVLLSVEAQRAAAPTRATWRAAAAALWVVVAMHVVYSVFRTAVGLDFALLPAPAGVLGLLGMAVGSGAALALTVKAMHAAASEANDPPIAPPAAPHVFLLLAAGVALRLLCVGAAAVSGSASAELVVLLLGSSGFVALGGVFVVRLTRRYVEALAHRRDELRWS